MKYNSPTGVSFRDIVVSIATDIDNKLENETHDGTIQAQEARIKLLHTILRWGREEMLL